MLKEKLITKLRWICFTLGR